MLQKISLRTPLFFSRALALWLAALHPAPRFRAAALCARHFPTLPQTKTRFSQPKQDASVKPGGRNQPIRRLRHQPLHSSFPDYRHNPLPLSSGGKFKIFVNQAISPAYVLGSGVSAA